MRLDKAAIAMLRVTALAWSIPFAQSAASPQAGVSQPQVNNAALERLDANRGGIAVAVRKRTSREQGVL